MIRFALAVFALLIAGCAEQTKQEEQTAVPKGASESTARHHAKLLSLLGGTVTTPAGEQSPSDYIAGKKNVLLYFSAKWCPPCRAFTPTLVKWVDENPDADVAVLLVSSDKSEEAMRDYMKDYEMPFSAVDYAATGKIRDSWGERGIPNLVWLGPDDEVIRGSYKGGKFIGPQPVLKAFADQNP
ncbi:MAG: redoxin domain-containing protein [Phycisphaerales bacterium]|nr:redoxin domain-containing protein [Phycisphaerales bacterium]